jgi:hypothetical protein
MCGRELTQLISTAKYYLDAADSLHVPDHELAAAVSADSARWSADRLSHPLSLIDTYSAHLASCAIRLATIHEILVGCTRKSWEKAYPNDANIAGSNVRLGIQQAIEILLRDNVGHAEDPTTQGINRSKFRKAAMAQLTFKEMGCNLQLRYQELADKLHKPQNA